MFSKHDFSILWKRVYPTLAHPHTPKVAAALAVAVLGAGAIVSTGSTSSPVSPAQQKEATALDSACAKQAWPYVDRYCADTPAYERGTRKVRVVNDRGETATMTMPLPIVEPKRPAPAQVIAKADTPIGPEVIPAAPAPQQEAALKNAAAPASAKTNSESPATPAKANAEPAAQQASLAQAQPSPEAMRARAEAPAPVDSNDAPVAKKSKAAGKPSDKLAAKERKATDKAVPADVIAAVEKAARRRGNQEVPPDVIAAVESATGGGEVYNSGAVQRVYIVP